MQHPPLYRCQADAWIIPHGANRFVARLIVRREEKFRNVNVADVVTRGFSKE
jgi:hypothetical protein